MLIHTVYFWLTKSATDEDRTEFRRRLATLGAIESVEAFYLGAPAKTPKRPVIDATYDYSITVILASKTAHDRYQEDPIHKDFVERCAHLFERVQVYDAE